jgi:hypothetical protein
MDVALVPRYDGAGFVASFRTVIIEFNPFDRFTGPALFDWERDSELLCGNGRSSSTAQSDAVELRIRTEPPGNIEDLLEMWREVFQTQERERMSLRYLEILTGPDATIVAKKKACSML